MTDLSGAPPTPPQTRSENDWLVTRWAYPIVADLTRLDKVYVGAGPEGALFSGRKDRLRLALTGRNVPIIDEATLTATDATSNKSTTSAPTSR